MVSFILFLIQFTTTPLSRPLLGYPEDGLSSEILLYLKRANNVDPDQMLQNTMSVLGHY